MLREDYEATFTTLGQPFEVGIPNKNGRLRLREIDIKTLKTDQLYPHRQVIRFNSSFVEVMDSWEFIRGRATALVLPMWGVCLFGLILAVMMGVEGFQKGVYVFTFFMLIMGGGISYIIYLNYKMAKYDLFGYTHYPIRFNRKTQKVYAFSPQQQKIVELNWKDLRFSAVREDRFYIELRASLVNKNNIVVEEIIFPYVSFNNYELIEQHLAFFKAYMEEDNLQRIEEVIPEFYDIYNRKENWRESFERVYMTNDELNELIEQTRPTKKDIWGVSMVAVIWFITMLSRRLGMFFSKLPQWPEHIEQECQIEKNDLYDSTGKQRHLAPLIFSAYEKIILFLGWLIGTSIFIAFLAGLAYVSWNR